MPGSLIPAPQRPKGSPPAPFVVSAAELLPESIFIGFCALTDDSKPLALARNERVIVGLSRFTSPFSSAMIAVWRHCAPSKPQRLPDDGS
jgi:hypothetical protein